MRNLRVANGAGFLGDDIDAPRRLVEKANLDVLTLEYLAELTMSILARSREKNPDYGFARDFLDVLTSIVPALKRQDQLRIITNAGGVNPIACARQSAKQLVAAGLDDVLIGCVTGDDLLPNLDRFIEQGTRFHHFETGEPLGARRAELVCANAYLGAAPIVEALDAGSRIVLTGRVADASLTVAPCVHHFRWPMNDWDRIAGASVAGHLIECGAQVTGGYSTRWRDIRFGDIGYPIADVHEDGSCVISKPPGTGGIVDRLSVAQQLVYEIGDPQHYLTPDVDVDFTKVDVKESGIDQVTVTGAAGSSPPETLKVSMAYRWGFGAVGQLIVTGDDCVDKAGRCAEFIRERLRAAGHNYEHFHVEKLGANEPERFGRCDASKESERPPMEVVLRIAVRDRNRDAVSRFTREFSPLITSGPAGLAGYASGRPDVQPVYAYWPTVIARHLVKSEVTVRRAADWLL